MSVVMPLFVVCVCVYVVFWRRNVLSIWNWQTDNDTGRNGGLSVSLLRSYIVFCLNRLMEVSVSSSHFFGFYLELLCFLGMAFIFIAISGERPWSVIRERCGGVWLSQTINAHDRCFEIEIDILMLMLDVMEVSLSFPALTLYIYVFELTHAGIALLQEYCLW